MGQTEQIIVATSERFNELIILWEASVRATHDFLPEETIATLRPLILSTYLPALTVHVYQDERGSILGFTGVSASKLEMLFISPDARGQGIGKTLLMHAVTALGVTQVDVNEQNPQAVGFYLHMGFKKIGRSERDGEGNPFPLLHMQT